MELVGYENVETRSYEALASLVVHDRSDKRAGEMLDMIKIFEEAGDDKKAELIILMNKLSGGKLGKKTNIEIKINEEKISLKDYLEEILPNADYKLANKNVMDYLNDKK